MSLIVCGINHKTAPLSVRERFAFSESCVPGMISDLLAENAMNEAVLLSTCNRTEVYGVANDCAKMRQCFSMPDSEHRIDPASYTYAYRDVDMVKHLIRVASGLDSQVLGEPQILGQIKRAYTVSSSAGAVGHSLKHLFPLVFSAVKEIRSQTAIGVNSISLAPVILRLAKRLLPDLSGCTILFIGAGEAITEVLDTMRHVSVKRILVANRTITSAQSLASDLGGQALRIADIPACLPDVDLIVTATASQLPLIGKGLIETVMSKRSNPLMIADLAVPRDVEPEVCALKDVFLYNIDELQRMVAGHKASREEAAREAELMISAQAQHAMRALRVTQAGDLIRQFRASIEVMRDETLEKFLLELAKTDNPRDVLMQFAKILTSKFLHRPTRMMRDFIYYEQLESIGRLKQLFEE